MKVKIGELKTHFSRYLRDLEGSSEPIEVCVREDTVAYLSSAKAEKGGNPNSAELSQRLEAAGITVSRWGNAVEPLRSPGHCEDPLRSPGHCEDPLRSPGRCEDPLRSPGHCEDPVGGLNSVETIRQERNY